MVPFSFMVSVRVRVVVLHPIFPPILIFDLTEAPAGRTTLLITQIQESPLSFPGHLILIPVNILAASPPVTYHPSSILLLSAHSADINTVYQLKQFDYEKVSCYI